MILSMGKVFTGFYGLFQDFRSRFIGTATISSNKGRIVAEKLAQAASVQELSIEQGSKQDIEKLLDKIFDSLGSDSSAINFKVSSKAASDFFAALEARSQRKNPEYHAALAELSSLREFKPEVLLDFRVKILAAAKERYGYISIVEPSEELGTCSAIPQLARLIKGLTFTIPDEKPSSFIKDLYKAARNLSIPAVIQSTKTPVYEVANPMKMKNLLYMSSSLSHCEQFGTEFAVDILSPDMKIGTPIYSATNGTVVKIEDRYPDRDETSFNFSSENNPVNIISIRDDKGFLSLYGHLKQVSSKVKVGERVKEGQQIAELGNNGPSDGLHLHYHYGEADKKAVCNIKSVPVRFH